MHRAVGLHGALLSKKGGGGWGWVEGFNLNPNPNLTLKGRGVGVLVGGGAGALSPVPLFVGWEMHVGTHFFLALDSSPSSGRLEMIERRNIKIQRSGKERSKIARFEHSAVQPKSRLLTRGGPCCSARVISMTGVPILPLLTGDRRTHPRKPFSGQLKRPTRTPAPTPTHQLGRPSAAPSPERVSSLEIFGCFCPEPA